MLNKFLHAADEQQLILKKLTRSYTSCYNRCRFGALFSDSGFLENHRKWPAISWQNKLIRVI